MNTNFQCRGYEGWLTGFPFTFQTYQGMYGSDFFSFNVENFYCGPNSVQDFRISVRGEERVSSFRALKRIGVFRRPRKIGQNAASRNMFNLQKEGGRRTLFLPPHCTPPFDEQVGWAKIVTGETQSGKNATTFVRTCCACSPRRGFD